MTKKTPRQRILNAVMQTFREMRPSIYVPNPKTRGKTSKGNLAFNALRIKIIEDTVDIYVDKNVAPYVVYTNEPWISPRWNGKKNPNEGWWGRFCEEFMRRLSKKLRGKLE